MFDREFHFFWMMITVVGTYSLLLFAFGSAFTIAVSAATVDLPGYTPTPGYTYAPVVNSGPQDGQLYYNVSSTPGTSVYFYFEVNPSVPANRLEVAINSFSHKYMMFQQLVNGGVRSIDYSTLDLLSHYDMNRNIISFNLPYLSVAYRLEIVPFPSVFIQDALNANDQYSVTISQLSGNVTIGTASQAQNGLLAVISLSVPNTNLFESLLLAGPIYLGVIYFTAKILFALYPTGPGL